MIPFIPRNLHMLYCGELSPGDIPGDVKTTGNERPVIIAAHPLPRHEELVVFVVFRVVSVNAMKLSHSNLPVTLSLA